jgi:hypothetical protein
MTKIISARDLRFKRLEIRVIGSRIMKVISVLKEVPQDRATLKVIAAVQEILRSKALGKEAQSDAFKLFVKTLSSPLLAHPHDFGLVSDEPARRPPVHMHSARGLADELNRYLKCFYEAPILEKEIPIAVCVQCKRLFMRSRSDAECCSLKCKTERWNEAKRKEDPEYWARIAKNYRNERDKNI